MRPDTVVVGGGFAGLAAATALSEAGARVLLLEARPHLGGRARSWLDPDTGAIVDNGQHLFLGCYRETLALLERIGSASGLNFQPRLSVPFVERGGAVGTFALPDWPRPFDLAAGLIRFPGLPIGDRFRLLRVARAARRAPRPEPGDTACSATAGEAGGLDDITVAGWLRALGQSGAARARLWDPLVIAALNDRPEAAAASMFLPVLRDGLLGGAAGSRIGVPRVGLSDLYAEPAAHYLRARGSEVRLRAPVRQVLVEGGHCAGAVPAEGAEIRAPVVIVAAPPAEALAILPAAVTERPEFAAAGGLRLSPIVSVYLWFGTPVTDLPFAGLIGGAWQWIFNREAVGGHPGSGHAVTLVRSAAHDWVDRSRDDLVHSAVEEVRAFFPRAARATLRHALLIKEKRATIAPSPGSLRLRPAWRTPVPGLLLSGDWTATGLPATIEGAVLSGHACARIALEMSGAGR
jgi:squalene-associated FAD-dependent desaturase